MKACKIISLSIFAILACISCNSRQIEDNSPKMEVIVQYTSPNSLKGVIRLTDKEHISRIGLLYWQADDSLQTTEMLVLDDVQTGDNPFELQNLQYRTTYVLMGFADAEQGADYKYAINSSPTKAMTDIELPDAEYQLVFSDEFEEDGVLSPHWKRMTNEIKSTGASYQTDEEHSFVKDGCLHIRMDKPNEQQYSLFPSAQLSTKDSFKFCYGKLECRLKSLFSLNGCICIDIIEETKGVRWVNSGEIMLEKLSGEFISSIVHGDEEGKREWIREKLPLPEAVYTDPTMYDEFHIIRMEWDTAYIQISLDDKIVMERDVRVIKNKGYDNNYDCPFIYNKDNKGFYINISVEKYYTQAINYMDYLPTEAQVDYIRIWQRKRLPEE